MAEVAVSDSSILSGQACVEYRGKCQDGQSLWLIDVQHISTDGKPHSSFVHDACAPQEQFHISHSDVDFTCKGRKCCMTEDIL